MSVAIPEDLSGIAEADAELSRLMAAESGEQGAGSEKPRAESANEGQRAGQQEGQQSNDTLAAADAGTKGLKDQGTKGPGPQNSQQEKTEGTAKGQEQQTKDTKYAKARERQEKSWKELNEQKDVLRREREEFDRLRKEHEQRIAEEESKFTPEQYEQAAKLWEEQGKFDMAEAARARAKELREQGPRDQGTKGLRDQETKEWTLKAGIDFPELAKANSPVQLRVAQLLKEEPDFKGHPKGVYLAARLASLEQEAEKGKAAAASVSAKDKQITELQNKIKELEGLMAPGNGGAAVTPGRPKSFEQMSDTEQFEELQRLAVETGSLR